MTIVLALLALFPAVAWVLLALALRLAGMRMVRAVGAASDWTAPLFLLGADILARSLFSSSAAPYLFTGIAAYGIALSYREWKTKKEVEVRPLLRRFWRVVFLMAAAVHTGLWITGLVGALHSAFR